MAGLLDAFDSPQMALAAGLLGGGNFGQALGRGMAGAQAVQLAEQRRREMEAQAEERRAMAEQRQAQMAMAQQKQARIDAIMARGQQGISPGAFQPSADGYGPTIPPQMAGQMRRPGGVLANLAPDDVLGLKMNGVDVGDLYKYINEPLELKQGSTYQNRTDGSREYMPKIGEGGQVKNGFYSNLPGYAGSIAEIKAAETNAVEGGRAKFDLVDVPMGDGTIRKVPRSVAVQNLTPGQSQPTPQVRPGQSQPGVTGAGYAGGDRDSANADSIRVMEAELRNNPNASAQDKAAIQREIARLQQQSGTAQYGVTRSPEETARATAQATSDVEPTKKKAAALDSAVNAMRLIDKALEHPGLDTATGLRGKLDVRNYISGTDATNFNTIADQLKGTAFLTAFESLRGGGVITELEGTKAENAIARMSKAQSSDAYREALADYKSVIVQGLMRAGIDPAKIGGGAQGGWGDSGKPAPANRAIPQGAINDLKMRKGDPRVKAQFDSVFGPGAADRVLGGG